MSTKIIKVLGREILDSRDFEQMGKNNQGGSG